MSGFDMSIPPGHFVETEHEARKWMYKFLDSVKAGRSLGLDSETSGITTFKDLVIVWSLSDGQDRICLPSKYIPLYRESILENPQVNFDLTNAKFDAHMFANSGADISKAGQWRDTLVQSWLINENNQGHHGLKESIRENFNRITPSFESIFGKIPPKKTDKKTGKIVATKTIADLIYAALADPVKRIAAADYASLDAYNSTALRQFFDAKMAEIELYPGMSLKDYFYQIEVPFTKVLWKMERRGLTVDQGYLLGLQKPMEDEMESINKDFAKEAGKIINLQSTNDIRWFFYEHLSKTVFKKTKGGVTGNKLPSTDNEVLEDWSGQGDPWATKLLRFRTISKTYGTYVVGLQEWLDPKCKIHTRLNQIGTVTGRLSSSDPNLQNIPSMVDDKYMIREAFIPSQGYILIVADYAQLEMRLMAHFSKDAKMIKAILDGVDLHCLTVSEMEGIPYKEVFEAVQNVKLAKKGKLGRALTEREIELNVKRDHNKATGFGIIYGIGGPKLANQLTRSGSRVIDEQEGWELIKKWLAIFPGVKEYIDSTKAWLWKYGKVQTILARFRRFGDMKGMSKRDAAMCERQGVNSIIQGTASDIVKMAMLIAESDPLLQQLGARLLLQVHDELIWECPNDPEVIQAVKIRVKEIMEHPFIQDLAVPLPVEVGHGYSWATAK